MSKPKRITLPDLYKELVENQYPIVDKDEKMVYVVRTPEPHHAEEHINRLFLIVDEDTLLLEEILFDFDAMAKQLTPGFDPEFLVKTALQEAAPARLLDIKERLENKNAKIQTKPRCVSLTIGGKPGAPVELILRR